ncbi:MAG: hypothetical protein NVS4B8_03450 [Herpetosiphon sp.]
MQYRSLLVIFGATLFGALIATFSYWSTHGTRDTTVIRQLVLAVFATPFATFLGWVIVDRARGWQAAFSCFLVYFFSIFAAARFERLMRGDSLSGTTGHALYFKLTIALNVAAGLWLALREVRADRSSACASTTARSHGDQGGNTRAT